MQKPVQRSRLLQGGAVSGSRALQSGRQHQHHSTRRSGARGVECQATAAPGNCSCTPRSAGHDHPLRREPAPAPTLGFAGEREPARDPPLLRKELVLESSSVPAVGPLVEPVSPPELPEPSLSELLFWCFCILFFCFEYYILSFISSHKLYIIKCLF